MSAKKKPPSGPRDGSSMCILGAACRYTKAFDSGTERQRQRAHDELLRHVRLYLPCTVLLEGKKP